ncbi:MAG: aminoacetone oxidase family FAD-binding enzyme [Acutalibacteraceae bacterium]
MAKKTAIIGGGASGLAASIEAKYESPQSCVVVFDRMKAPGKKILATGNGRCNFTNEDLSPKHFYGDPDFLRKVLTSCFADTENFFYSLGVLPYREDGRVYPRSQQSATVRDTLVSTAERLGVIFKTESEISSIKKSGNKFTVDGECFDSVIICGGGKSSEVQGSDGSAYRLLENFGHKLTPLYPALCGLLYADRTLSALKGVRAECNATLYGGNSVLGSEEGEVQFTDKGISGIPIMNLSHLCEDKKNLSVSLDLVPEVSDTELTEHLNILTGKCAKSEAETVLNGIVNIKLVYEVMKRCFIKPHTLFGDLKRGQIDNTVKALKDFTVDIKGTRPFSDSQITKGGIDTGYFDPTTMMSKLESGVFACGEVLNIHGDCGGYNLHLAFTTGRIAGHNAVKE